MESEFWQWEDIVFQYTRVDAIRKKSYKNNWPPKMQAQPGTFHPEVS